jgi:hypothetical protein
MVVTNYVKRLSYFSKLWDYLKLYIYKNSLAKIEKKERKIATAEPTRI